MQHVRPGDYVTFESIIICHHCNACRSGQLNQCTRARLLGLEEDGLFGTVVDLPSQLAHNVTAMAGTDEGLKAAACADPAAVAYVACENARVRGGDTDVLDGPEALCELLKSPERVADENCKVLVRLNGRKHVNNLPA